MALATVRMALRQLSPEKLRAEVWWAKSVTGARLRMRDMAILRTRCKIGRWKMNCASLPRLYVLGVQVRPVESLRAFTLLLDPTYTHPYAAFVKNAHVSCYPIF